MNYNDEYYDYGMYEDYYDAPTPPHCIICNKYINPKNFDENKTPDTEFYIVAGSYFEELFSPSKDFEPLDYCCIHCYEQIILPFIKQQEHQYELYQLFNQLRNNKYE